MKEKSVWKRFRHWLLDSWFLYAGVRAFVWFLDTIPLSCARAIGRCGGRLAYHLDRGHREICRKNLTLAFPEKNDAERAAILKASYVHLGLCAADFCRFRSLTREEMLANWVVQDPGSEENVRTAMARKKGVICVAAHIGNWELSGFAAPSLGIPTVSISRRIASERIENFIARMRSRLGNDMVNQDGALRAMLRKLKQNEGVGIIMDQHGGRDSPRIPFFGAEASTVDSCARLHLKTGAALLCCLMLRRPDGIYRWRAKFVETGELRGSEDEQVRQILAACNREFEIAIREAPEQWLWMHKRWR